MAHPLLQLARLAIADSLAGRDWRGEVGRGASVDTGAPSRGCFVSLKLAGRLRGCIGTVLPAWPTLEAEVAHNAVAAATRDPRFAPLRAAELGFVQLSIDLLTVPTPVATPAELDAARYGVLVRGGSRLGVLLPAIPGVRTPEQQIAICLEKAQLPAGSPYSLERFEVERFHE